MLEVNLKKQTLNGQLLAYGSIGSHSFCVQAQNSDELDLKISQEMKRIYNLSNSKNSKKVS